MYLRCIFPASLADIQREKLVALNSISDILKFSDLFSQLSVTCALGVLSNALHDDIGIRTASWDAILCLIDGAHKWRARQDRVFDEDEVCFYRNLNDAQN